MPAVDHAVPTRGDARSPDLRHRNDFIQYLRGYAALMVVLDHSMLRLAKGDPAFRWLAVFAGDLGAMGVQIFFVISGYIMLAIGYDAFERPGAPWRFWLARIKRIAPPYYIATGCALLMPAWLGGGAFGAADVVTSLLFVAHDSRPAEGQLLPILGVGWTLNYEMFFYLIFGVALAFRRSVGVGFSLAALASLVVVGEAFAHRGGVPVRSLLFFYTYHLMGLFAVGMGVALWQRSRYFYQIPLAMPALLGAGAAVAAVVLLDRWMPGHYPLWRTLLLYGLASLAVLLCVAARPRRRSAMLERIGDASFSIYLFHGFALGAVIAGWQAMFGLAHPFARILVCVMAGLVAGLLAYRFIEQPIVRVLKPRSRQAREG